MLQFSGRWYHATPGAPVRHGHCRTKPATHPRFPSLHGSKAAGETLAIDAALLPAMQNGRHCIQERGTGAAVHLPKAKCRSTGPSTAAGSRLPGKQARWNHPPPYRIGARKRSLPPPRLRQPGRSFPCTEIGRESIDLTTVWSTRTPEPFHRCTATTSAAGPRFPGSSQSV